VLCVMAGSAVVRIYCADHTYVSLKVRMDAMVGKIIELASTKLSLGEDLVLCEVKSNGGTSRVSPVRDFWCTFYQLLRHEGTSTLGSADSDDNKSLSV